MRIVRAVLIGFVLGTLVLTVPSPSLPFGLREALAQEASTITNDMVPIVIGADGGQGAGVVYAPGVVLTAAHVVDENQARAKVLFGALTNITPFAGTVTCISERDIDFAVISLDEVTHPFTPMSMSLTPVEVGQPVIVAGWAAMRWTTYATVVIRIEFDGGVRGEKGEIYTVAEMFVMAHVPSGPVGGMSGGGVFDIEGRLIGIICCGRKSIGNFIAEVSAVPLHRSTKSCALP